MKESVYQKIRDFCKAIQQMKDIWDVAKDNPHVHIIGMEAERLREELGLEKINGRGPYEEAEWRGLWTLDRMFGSSRGAELLKRLEAYETAAMALLPTGQERPWEDDNLEYMPSSEAIARLTDGGLSLGKLSKILKPDGDIRYMRKGRRSRVHVIDFIRFVKAHHLTDEAAAEMADGYIADMEARKASGNRRKKRSQTG